jgi:hypothetical protein
MCRVCFCDMCVCVVVSSSIRQKVVVISKCDKEEV